ncbi:MAG: hypothetical protein AAF456_07660 [Planctomycetota bacterium]
MSDTVLVKNDLGEVLEVEVEVLLRNVRSGVVRPDVLVCVVENSAWQPLSESAINKRRQWK